MYIIFYGTIVLLYYTFLYGFYTHIEYRSADFLLVALTLIFTLSENNNKKKVQLYGHDHNQMKHYIKYMHGE